MKIDLPSSEGQASKTQFGIGDLAVILEILRSKMYSNPIKTVCQEIMSNCRDAHVEAGKAEEPICVTIEESSAYPGKVIRFTDFGLGISPDRMANVFLLYGTSTKRASDDQIGGFGLGAKSPFAYSDVYRIFTVTPVEDGMMNRVYQAKIDESKIGTLTLLYEEKTDDPQGTTIEVPIKDGDVAHFVKHLTELTVFWDVKPIVFPSLVYPSRTYRFKAEGWCIPENRINNYYDFTTQAVIGGIPYAIPHETMRMLVSSDEDLKSLVSAGVELHFKTGELKVTANRESIDLSATAVKTIKQRLEEALEELRALVAEECDALSSMAEAMKLHNRVGRLPVKIMYTGREIISSVLRDLDLKRYTRASSTPNGFKAIKYKVDDSSWYDVIKPEELTDPTKLVVECDKYSINNLIGLFQNNPVVKTLILVKFESASDRATACTHSAYDLFGFPMLSTFPKAKAYAKPPMGGGKIGAVKIFEPSMAPHWRATDQTLESGTGVYVVVDGNKAEFGSSLLTHSKLEFLVHNIPDVSSGFKLYGILKNRMKKIGPGWKPLEQHLRERLAELKLKIGARLAESDRLRVWSQKDREWLKLLLAKLPVDHFLPTWHAATERSDAAATCYDKAVRIQALLREGGLSIDTDRSTAYQQHLLERYPMLHLSLYSDGSATKSRIESAAFAEILYRYIMFEDRKRSDTKGE